MTQTHEDNAVSTIRGETWATVLGPDNVAVGAQNPGAPSTDSGSMPNLKFPFAAAHNRLLDGGWAREVTVRDRASRDDVGRGDLWNFRSGFPHSIQALEDCEFLLVFDDGNFSENSAAIPSSGPAAAAAACQARRSGSVSGSVASANARRTARRSMRPAAR